MQWKRGLALAAVAATAACAMAQDSVAKPDSGCVGDGLSPWSTNEQCAQYIVELSPFTTSWGTEFGIAPIVKSSKSSAGFTGSLISAQGMSRLQVEDSAVLPGGYFRWNGVGFGVNPNNLINEPGQLIPSNGVTGNRFAVGFAEFSGSYNGIVGAFVHVQPTAPSVLWVARRNAASNSCDSTTNVSQFGFGSIDAYGNMVYRGDGFGGAAAGCGFLPLAGQNIIWTRLADRDCGSLNIVSESPASFDGVSTDLIVDSSGTTHGTPGIHPQGVLGAGPRYLGTNFSAQFVRGVPGSVTSDLSHLAPPATNQRGNLSYTSDNCSFLGSTAGVAGVLGVAADTSILNVFGLNASSNVTGRAALQLPVSLVDNNDGFDTAAIQGGNPLEFDHYHDQVAFRGGNGQIALGADQQGNLLAAAQVEIPTGGNDWPINGIAVARLDCASGNVEWTLAGYNTGAGLGKPILDGPGGNVVGRMSELFNIPGAPLGPSVSAPMIDSVGNVWFLSAIELDGPTGLFFTTGLLRSVYNPATFSYELELVFTLREVFPGINSGLNYQISFLSISDGDSVSSGTAWSQNISDVAHLNIDPSNLPTRDPKTLGGLIISAEIIYDVDNSGTFEDCTNNPGSPDQDYNVLLYVGSLETGGVTPCDGDLTGDSKTDFADFAQLSACFGSPCGDLTGDNLTDFADFAVLSADFGCDNN